MGVLGGGGGAGMSVVALVRGLRCGRQHNKCVRGSNGGVACGEDGAWHGGSAPNAPLSSLHACTQRSFAPSSHSVADWEQTGRPTRSPRPKNSHRVAPRSFTRHPRTKGTAPPSVEPPWPRPPSTHWAEPARPPLSPGPVLRRSLPPTSSTALTHPTPPHPIPMHTKGQAHAGRVWPGARPQVLAGGAREKGHGVRGVPSLPSPPPPPLFPQFLTGQPPRPRHIPARAPRSMAEPSSSSLPMVNGAGGPAKLLKQLEGRSESGGKSRREGGVGGPKPPRERTRGHLPPHTHPIPSHHHHNHQCKSHKVR